MIDIKTFAKSKDTGGGKVGTSTATTYITGIATEADHANRADRAKRADSADQAAYANQSGTALTANYAATAGEVREDAETLQNFLRKDESDDIEVVHRKVDFKKDVVAEGTATLFDALVDILRSHGFDAATQSGFGLTKDSSGKYTLSLTNLEVWGKAVYNELQIRKLSSIGGNVWLSAASSKIVHVAELYDTAGNVSGYRCYFLAEEDDTVADNPWRVGDLARCETYEESSGRRMYWMLVSAVSASSTYVYGSQRDLVKLLGGRKCHYVVLTTANVSASSNAVPQAGDTIVLDGHRLGTGDTDRTNLICIESTGTGTPRIVGMAGITDFTHEGKDVFKISPAGVQFRSDFIKFFSADGKEEVPWKDGKDGAPGKDGQDGKDGLSVLQDGVPLVFSTDADGLVAMDALKSAKVRVMRGTANVTAGVTNVSSQDGLSDGCKSVARLVSTGADPYILVQVPGSSIASSYVDSSDTSKGKVSVTSGFADISFTYGGRGYHAQVPFVVNVARFTGSLSATSKSLSSNYTELSKKVTSMGNDVDSLSHGLNELSSSIEQTARKISLSVTEKAVGRRNLLPGSAFRRQDDGPMLNFYEPHGDQGIYIGEGIGGTNCVKCKSYYDGTNYQYSGVFWRALGATRNVKIERGKKYVMSCWVKCDTTAANRIRFENHFKESAISLDRLGSYPMSPNSTFAVREAGVWELFSCVIDATSAKYDYLEVDVFVLAMTKGETVNAWFCRPMLEEGEEYNGWTLSEQDYDYVGGNLLDNARSLTLGDNLGTVQGSIVSGGYEAGVSVIYAQASTSYIDILRWGTPDGDTYAANTDYVFSFMARGSGGITAYFYRGDNNAALLTETCDGTVTDGDTGQDGNAYLALDGGWRRYWVHWRTKSSNMPQMVLLRVSAGSTAYATQPKLEVGATVTPWTEKRSDMVDRQALLATGIDIANKKVTVTSDNFTVRNNSGDTTLLVDQAGRLNSEIIEAKTVKTYNENGAHIEIENGLMQVFGTKGVANFRFGVTDDGEAILSYYDNNGEWKYDLGPNQFDAKYTVASSLTAVEVVRARDSAILGVAAFYTGKTFSTGSKSYSLYVVASEALQNKVFGLRIYASDSDEVKKNPHSGYQPFARKSTSFLYRYTAARVSGKVQPDKSLGLTTQALAAQADGKYFTSSSVLGDGTSLKNLASDVYFEKGATVSMAPYPMSEVGKSFDWPAYTIRFIDILQGVCSQKTLYSIIKQAISGSEYVS